jgi:SAM-dependent methyltransferase
MHPIPSGAAHWDAVYAGKGTDEVSWFQREPEVSLRLLAPHPGSVVDIGAGASLLAGRLIAAGRTDLTLLDVSANALEITRQRLGPDSSGVTFVTGDVLTWDPGRTFDCWHDRAVFHFLVDADDVAAYVRQAARLVSPGGTLVLATFAADGPTSCSGLPTARYAAAELAGLFGDSFTAVHSELEDHVTPWQAHQQFTWVVLTRS